MIIDVMISFNDIDRKLVDGLGASSFKYIDFYKQLLLCIRSLNDVIIGSENEYRVYVLYSKEFSEYKKQEIRNLGATLIYDEINYLEDRICNRISCYTNNMGGDYSLIIDTDIVFLREPNFDFTKDMMMKPFPYSSLSEKQFIELYKMCNVEVKNKYLKLNNGCVLIKNVLKNYVYEKQMEFKQILFREDILKKYPTLIHFIEEVITGMILNMVDNSGYFGYDINSQSIGDEVSIYHYAGVLENKKILETFCNKYNLSKK